MVTKKVENKSESALVPPNGPTIPAGGFRIITDWEKKQSEVVEAWIRAGALVVSDPDGDEKQAAETTDLSNTPPLPTGGNEGDDKGPAANDGEPKTEAQLNELTNDQLKALIEEKGGTVKSSWNKAELVQQALELKA